MVMDIVSRKQIHRGIAVKQQMELVLRVVGHHALDRLQREPTDAVQPPRNNQSGIDGNHGHGGEATAHPRVVERTHILEGESHPLGACPGASCGRFGTSDHEPP